MLPGTIMRGQKEEYTDWQWWLARSEGGDWELLTWGY